MKLNHLNITSTVLKRPEVLMTALIVILVLVYFALAHMGLGAVTQY